MKTVGELLREAVAQLKPCSDTPRLDSEILLAYAMNVNRAQLMARLKDRVDVQLFQSLLERRLNYEPLAYILGEWEFFSLSFVCRPPVFVPRPETELLVERVLHLTQGKSCRMLEVGTGTGCIAISLAVYHRRALIVAVDKSAAAVSLARENVLRHHVVSQVHLVHSDTLDLFPECCFDVLCSNPPYVERSAWDSLSPVIRLYEDRDALLAGDDGLDCIRMLARKGKRVIKSGGFIALEIGLGQSEAVRDILSNHGFDMITITKDLSGIERVVTARIRGV